MFLFLYSRNIVKLFFLYCNSFVCKKYFSHILGTYPMFPIFMNTDKDYIFLESSLSICSVCQKRVEAKIIERNGSIFILKNCLEHGPEEGILEEDAEYFFKKRKFDKPGSTCKTQTKILR